MRRMTPRRARRFMERMGVKVKEVPNVQEVTIKTDSRELIIKDPEVTIMEVRGQKTFQIVGGSITEKTLEVEGEIPDEDVQLVANQTGKTLDEAREALKETGGDLAKAILLLQSKAQV